MSDGCCGFEGGFGGAGGAGPAPPFEGIEAEDDGTPVAGGPFDTIDFVGDGVAATDGGGGVLTVTIPGGIAGIEAQDDGTPIVGGPFDTINFFGGGVAASTGGGGVLDVEVPGITLQDDGVAVPNPPHIVFDFQGEGVTVNDLGAGVAQILIPGSAAYLPEQWFAEDLSTDRTDEPMATRVSGFFETFVPVRSGSLVGMVSRLTEAMVDGTLTVEVTINGTLELSVTHTSVLNPTIGIATEAPGVIPYAAGDVIAVRYSTSSDFSPTTQDVEVALSIFETL